MPNSLYHKKSTINHRVTALAPQPWLVLAGEKKKAISVFPTGDLRCRLRRIEEKKKRRCDRNLKVQGTRTGVPLQGGPLPVISGVISPINGLING